MGRQEKGLVHIQRRDQLTGQQVPAGIAGHHQAEQALVVKPGLAEQGRQPVDAGGEIGGQGVVIVGAQHHQGVAPADGGVHLLHHGAYIYPVRARHGL